MVNLKLSQSDSLQPSTAQPTLRWPWFLFGTVCLLTGSFYLAQADLGTPIEKASPEAVTVE